MNQITCCIFLASFLTINAFGQNNLNDLNVIFKHDFENNTLGDYLYNEWESDWLDPAGNDRQSAVDIAQDANDQTNPSKALQFNFPANSLGSTEGGATWYTSIHKTDEIYVSYDLMFMPGFEYQLGGKLPSVQGGSVTAGVKPNGYDGFTGGLLFRQNGMINFYIYYPDSRTTKYGETFLWGTAGYPVDYFKPSSVIIEYGSGAVPLCRPGEWHNITYRMVLNTVKPNGGGNFDGILEAYFDGKLVLQLSHLLFRHTTALGIDYMRMYTFFGGDDDASRNPIEEWLRVDNVILYTFKDGIDVPRGNKLSPTDRTINYWRNFSINYTIPPASPVNLTSTAVTKSTISLKWSDKSNNEAGFAIYRSSSPTDGFDKIGTVTTNVTGFTDKSLALNTAYYYKVIAYNPVGYSDYTNVLQAVTLTLQIPAVPTSFYSPGRTKSTINLGWTDNAKNELGFKIYRSLSATDGFTEIGSVGANAVTFTDNSLQPLTVYYYRIRAFNDDGYSPYSAILPVSTLGLQLPAAPAGLTTGSLGYKSCTLYWSDKSNNETGFELERTGPNSSGTVTYLKSAAGTNSYADQGLAVNSTYFYRIRAFNDDGYSTYATSSVQITTPYIAPPSAPSALKGTGYCDTSITITWKDNSYNESGFVVTRSLIADPSKQEIIKLNANDTMLIDNPLLSGTSYLYTVKAINIAGNSPSSNKRVATTRSVAETKRVTDGLIAYYNFAYNPDFVLYDESGFQNPIDLRLLQPAAVSWKAERSLSILSNTMLVSQSPARKITQALKNTNEITVECWVKPVEPILMENSRLISLGLNDNEIGFVLDQHFSNADGKKNISYSVRMQTESTTYSGFPEFTSDQTISYINLNHIVYIRNQEGKEVIYLNGKKSTEGFRPSDFSTWNENFHLRFGNENDSNHPWTGTFYSVALYNKALSTDEVKTNYSAGPCDSLKKEDITYQIKFYPNPVTDFATIEISPLEQQDVAPQTIIKVLDLFGKVCYQYEVFNPNNQQSVEIDFRHFTNGIYILQVISGNQFQSSKLVVQ